MLAFFATAAAAVVIVGIKRNCHFFAFGFFVHILMCVVAEIKCGFYSWKKRQFFPAVGCYCR